MHWNNLVQGTYLCCLTRVTFRSGHEKQLYFSWRDIFAPLPIPVMKDAAWSSPLNYSWNWANKQSCIKHEFVAPPEHVQEECTAIKVPFLGWKQHSSAGSSGSARLCAAAPRGTHWHGWLLSMKVHVPGHRGLSHPSHVTSFRASECTLDLSCAVLCVV